MQEILEGFYAGKALRMMHTLGILELLIPEFHGIDALVIRDAYHRYTVDEHTLVVIDTLHGLEQPQTGQMRLPLSSCGKTNGLAPGGRWSATTSMTMACAPDGNGSLAVVSEGPRHRRDEDGRGVLGLGAGLGERRRLAVHRRRRPPRQPVGG